MPSRLLPALLLSLLMAMGFGTAAGAMTFGAPTATGVCAARTCILATGDIDETSSAALEAYLKTNKVAAGSLVILDSPGGDVAESLALGNLIRSARLDTMVAAYDAGKSQFKAGSCASDCAYAFLGGVRRNVGKGSRIGVHQIISAGQDWALSVQDGMAAMSTIAVHVRHLCGSLDVLIPALKTHANQMYWLSSSELSRFAIVTSATADA